MGLREKFYIEDLPQAHADHPSANSTATSPHPGGNHLHFPHIRGVTNCYLPTSGKQRAPKEAATKAEAQNRKTEPTNQKHSRSRLAHTHQLATHNTQKRVSGAHTAPALTRKPQRGEVLQARPKVRNSLHLGMCTDSSRVRGVVRMQVASANLNGTQSSKHHNIPNTLLHMGGRRTGKPQMLAQH